MAVVKSKTGISIEVQDLSRLIHDAPGVLLSVSRRGGGAVCTLTFEEAVKLAAALNDAANKSAKEFKQ